MLYLYKNMESCIVACNKKSVEEVLSAFMGCVILMKFYTESKV